MNFRKVSPAFALVLLAGCGGGASNPASGSEIGFGDLIGRAAVSSPPKITTSTDTTVTGLVGAFTSLRIRDQRPSTNEGKIVYSQLMPDLEFFVMNPDGSENTRITDNESNEYAPELSPDGRKIAFVSDRDGPNSIYIMNLDGSSVTRITNNASNYSDPTWSPDMKFLAAGKGVNFQTDIVKIDVATKVETPLANAAWEEQSPNWSPDGKWIAFESNKNFGVSSWDIEIIRPDGTGRFLREQDGSQLTPEWSPDSTRVAVVNQNKIELLNPFLTVGFSAFVPSVADAASTPSWSPDGTRIAYAASTPSLVSVRSVNVATGASVTLSRNTDVSGHPSWKAVSRDVSFVGGSGVFGSAASGIIFSQQGEETKTVLAFGATTLSTVVMTAETGLESTAPNLVYSIDADTINYISYAELPSFKARKIVGSGLAVATADGALVTINAATGFVSNVIPFDGTRSSGKPRVSSENGVTVYRGSFTAVFDGEGKNLAPGGATEVRLEASGGLVVR